MKPVNLPPGSFLLGPDRPSRRRFGVPPGGPFDRESCHRSQIFGSADTYELGYFGAEFSFEASGCFVLCGALRPVLLGGANVPPNSICHAEAKQSLTIGIAQTGVRSYLSWEPLGRTPAPRGFDPPSSLRSERIRVLPGPQACEMDLTAFLRTQHTASTHLDRIGLRLCATPDGQVSREFPSEPQCVGAIQITPDGTPIIIGPDGPTLGGYPKIAVVISADLDRLAQVAPAQTLQFELVSLEEAQTILRKQTQSQMKALKQLAMLLRQPSF